MTETRFPLSFSQERLWFADQIAPGDPSYLVATSVRLAAAIEPGVLEAALNQVVARQEALRTRFVEEDGVPVQLVADRLHVPLTVHDLRRLPPGAERDRRRDHLVAETHSERFDLGQLPLIRTSLVICADDDAVLSVCLHHIVADGWSLGILFGDLNAYLRGTGHLLPELAIGYPDFAAWQQERIELPDVQDRLRWWAETLSGAEPLQLPTDRPRRPDGSARAGRIGFTVPAEVASRLLDRGRRHGCTPFMTLLAGYAILLSRYAGQQDVLLGSYTAGRDRAELEPLIGFFVNALPIRLNLADDPSFDQLLDRVREVVLEAFAHQDVPFAGIVQRVAPTRDATRNPLFDVVFHLYNVPGADAGEPADDHPAGTPLDLVCSMWQSGPVLYGHLDYRTELFEAATVRALLQAFATLLGELADGSDHPVSALELLSEAAWRAETLDVNRTDRAVPAGDVWRAFELQAAASPDAVAFQHAGRELRYHELQAQVLELAARLRTAGAGPGRVVGLHLPRCLDLPVALLATLHTGAAFLPLDPALPAGRLATMIATAQPRVLVSNRGEQAADLLTASPRQLPAAPSIVPTHPPEPAGDLAEVVPGHRPAPDELAYVIFTSGSTGEPKGVQVEHRQVWNRLQWMWREYPFAAGEIGCQKTSVGFVDSIWELLGPLLRGVPTVIVTDAELQDPQLLVAALARHRVGRIWLVPSLLRELLDAVADLGSQLPLLRFWVLSGEPLPRTLANRFRQQLPAARLYNLYGTSEVWDATWQDAGDDAGEAGQVPIGRPIDNVQAYVLDERLRPIPRGTVGELVIGGCGVARGYLPGRSGVDRESAFVDDPFRPGGRLYRTGDLCRRRPDGTLELLGRRDQQVKLRGFRVEPAEVEAALLAHPRVRDAVVVTRPGPGEQPTLVGFVTGSVDLDDLQAALAHQLPEYLRPSRLQLLTELPLTTSGKVDRARLPTDLGPRPAAGPAETALQRLIAEVWADLLDRNELNLDDNFFTELGGHSLLGMRMMARLRRLLAAELPVRWLFEAPTVHRLAELMSRELGAARAEETASIVLEVAAMTDDQARVALARMQARP